MENSAKTLLKEYLTSQTINSLFFNCVFIQFNSKKVILILQYLLLPLQLTLHKKSSFWLKISSVNVTETAVSCRNSEEILKKALMENFIFCAVWNFLS